MFIVQTIIATKDMLACARPCKPLVTYGRHLDIFLSDLPLCKTDTDNECFHNVLKTAEKSILKRPCTKIQFKVKHSISQYEMDEDSRIPQNVARFILYF